MFGQASKDGDLIELMTALERRNVVLVGPEYLRGVKGWKQVVVPEKNAWLEYERVKGELDAMMDWEGEPVVLFCAGMMSNVLIHDFHNEVYATMIDCGSVFDPYAGRCTRRYHKGIMERMGAK